MPGQKTPKADSFKIIDLYPFENNSEQDLDLSLRRLFCDFLGCCLLITLARGEDKIEDQVRSVKYDQPLLIAWKATILLDAAKDNE